MFRRLFRRNVARGQVRALLRIVQYRTFSTTNPIENLNGLIAQFTANVTRWRDGQMVLRWIGAALTDASGRFRAVRGYRDMKRLLNALAKRAEGISATDHKAA